MSKKDQVSVMLDKLDKLAKEAHHLCLSATKPKISKKLTQVDTAFTKLECLMAEVYDFLVEEENK